METSTILENNELISNRYRVVPLYVPDITRIDNVQEYVENSTNFNGDINTLVDHLDSNVKQCQSIVELLREELGEKKALLETVKKEMLDLQEQVNLPDSDQRFLAEDEKILIQFSDETEITECNVPGAMKYYNIKMALTYCKIFALDMDIKFVAVLQNLAMVNRDFVKNYYNQTEEEQDENENILNKPT